MGTRYSESGRDVVKSEISEALQDMTAAISESAGSLSISVGSNILTPEFRFEVERALQQIRDVLREKQYPEGAAATNFAYLLSVPAVKSQVVVGNAAEVAVATLTEDSILVSYNQFTGTGQGSSGPYGSAIDKIRDFIREFLSTAIDVT